MIKKLVIASNNPGKLREISDILAALGIESVPQSVFGVPEADEPHATFIENALAKARHATFLTGFPSLAEDSGLSVDALGGAPGVHSARYAGEPRSDERNNAKLLEVLGDRDDRQAHYYCAIVVLRHATDPQPLIAQGDGGVKFFGRLAVTAGSVTIPCSLIRYLVKPERNLRRTERISLVTAARRWRCWAMR